jgi:hypothetical protein
MLGRFSRQLRKNCAGVNMVYSPEDRVSILEHYFASKSCAAVREAFSNALSTLTRKYRIRKQYDW